MTLHITTQATNQGTSGPDLVFLHGWGLSGRIMQPLAERMSHSARCHCVDLPGHGASGGGYAGLNNWVDAVIESLDAVVRGPAVYVGWSLGGLVSLGLARRHPEQVAGLGLIATLPRMVRSTDWPWGLKHNAIESTRRGLAHDFATTLSEFLMQQVLGEPGAAKAVRSLRNDLIDQPPRRDALERGLDILFEADFRDILADINCPAFWLAGARDRMAHPDGMRWAAERMPGGTSVQVDRAAHAPFVSHEKKVAGHLADLLGQVRDAA